MMDAAVRERYGAPESVAMSEEPMPQPAPDEVLVKVHAAGVDRGVLHLVEGTPYVLRLVYGLRRPKRPVLGLDLAGTVVETGERVTRFAIGDEVLGIGRGSMAQYCAALEVKLVRKPMGLDIAEAAALPVSGLTALQAVEAAGVETGERVLVLGGLGRCGNLRGANGGLARRLRRGCLQPGKG
jgi:NADPH:quinone reductase-like Zn-dependent oxidoreductase